MSQEIIQPLTPDQPRDPRDEHLVGGVLGPQAEAEMGELIGESSAQKSQPGLPDVESAESPKDKARFKLNSFCQELDDINIEIEKEVARSGNISSVDIRELVERRKQLVDELREYVIKTFNTEQAVSVYEKKEGFPVPTDFSKKIKVVIPDNLDFCDSFEKQNIFASYTEGGKLFIQDMDGNAFQVPENSVVVEYNEENNKSVIQGVAELFIRDDKFFELYFQG